MYTNTGLLMKILTNKKQVVLFYTLIFFIVILSVFIPFKINSYSTENAKRLEFKESIVNVVKDFNNLKYKTEMMLVTKNSLEYGIYWLESESNFRENLYILLEKNSKYEYRDVNQNIESVKKIYNYSEQYIEKIIRILMENLYLCEQIKSSEDFDNFDTYLLKSNLEELKIILSMSISQRLDSINKSVYLIQENYDKEFYSSLITLLITLFLIISFTIFFALNQLRKKEKRDLKQNIQLMDAIIDALAYQVELKDNYTGKHVERTSIYVKLICQELLKNNCYKEILTKGYIEGVVRASILHDIGKIGIPDSILLKPGKLTKDEYDIIKTHTILGANTIKMATEKLPFISFLDLAEKLIESHHEAWDGSGYPNSLSGVEIPLCGRIMAIADVYDAMRMRRIYKEPISHDKCIEEIASLSGIKFDPQIVAAFMNIEKDIEKLTNV